MRCYLLVTKKIVTKRCKNHTPHSPINATYLRYGVEKIRNFVTFIPNLSTIGMSKTFQKSDVIGFPEILSTKPFFSFFFVFDFGLQSLNGKKKIAERMKRRGKLNEFLFEDYLRMYDMF